MTLPCMLVAMPSMGDANFSKSVIFLLEHNKAGALGLIVNRPSALSLKSMIDFPDSPIPEELPAWYGGPVETTSGIILHNQMKNNGDQEITSNICLSASKDTLIDMIETARTHADENGALAQLPLGVATNCCYPYRFVVGYAGWGPDQLDEEIRAGAWLYQPLNEDLLFHTPWFRMWDKAIAMTGSPVTRLTSSPQAYLN